MDPLLLDIPEHIETARLVIRLAGTDDAVPMQTAIEESFVELAAWMPWAANGQTLDETRAYRRRAMAKFLLREELAYSIFDRENGGFIGNIGIHNIDWDIPSCEIGYWLRTSLTGRGYMTEAVNALTAMCFETLGAQRVQICCEAGNERSAAVATRAGYQLEGQLRNHRRDTKGNLADTLIFSKVRV